MKPPVRSIIPATFLWVLFAPAVLAQVEVSLEAVPAHVAAQPAARSSHDAPHPIHVTDDLLRQPVAQRAIRRAAKYGRPTATKHAQVFEVGDTTTFKVRELASQDTSDVPVFRTVAFVLKRDTTAFRLWVEVGELEGGRVRDSDLEALFSALADETPPGSIAPDRGIIDINEEVFGKPPVVNPGDSAVDILLTDVKDDFRAGSGFIAGFVDPLDVFTNEANERAILYLDTFPGLFTPSGTFRDTQFIEETAAHEYQHLIHLNFDPREITFVNEGLSEWASVINGYTPRVITFLRNPNRFNVPLFRWSRGLSDNVLEDYQRAGLFTTYVAEQIGVEATGAITRTSEMGYDAYATILGELGLTVEEVVFNFHTATVLNDRDVAPEFGFLTEPFRSLRAEPVTDIDARFVDNVPSTEIAVEAGGFTLLRFRNVTDLSILIDVMVDDESDSSSLIARRDRMELRAFLFQDGEVVETRTFEPSLDLQLFPGTFDQVDIVVSNADPRPAETEEPNGVHLFFEVDFTTEDKIATERVAFDTGELAFVENEMGEQEPLLRRLGPDAILLNGFEVPQDAVLLEVSVAPFFLGTFDGAVPAGAPTDFTLLVFNGEGEFPGQEILALDVENVQENTDRTLDFVTIDLEPFAEDLSAVSDTVYVGISNAGTDENLLLFAVSPLVGTGNPSFIKLSPSAADTSAFIPLSSLTVSGVSLADKVFPIRATFASQQAVAAEDEAVLPARVALHQNYPNPFNPTTTIRYEMPEAAEVHLAVYDMLGRRIAVLSDGLQPAGVHEVDVDAGRWASGLYFYTLETGGRRLTRAMMLMQ